MFAQWTTFVSIQIRESWYHAIKQEVLNNGIWRIISVHMNLYAPLRLSWWRGTLIVSSKTPAGDIPIRSITLASDGSCLVAGNNKASSFFVSFRESERLFVGSVLCLEIEWRKYRSPPIPGSNAILGSQKIHYTLFAQSRCTVEHLIFFGDIALLILWLKDILRHVRQIQQLKYGPSAPCMTLRTRKLLKVTNVGFGIVLSVPILRTWWQVSEKTA